MAHKRFTSEVNSVVKTFVNAGYATESNSAVPDFCTGGFDILASLELADDSFEIVIRCKVNNHLSGVLLLQFDFDLRCVLFTKIVL